MRTLFALCLVILIGWSGARAQKTPGATAGVASRGESARAAIESMAAALGCTVRYEDGIDPENDLEFHVWLRVHDLQAQRAARLLALATGKSVRVDAARRVMHVGDGQDAPRAGGLIRGYDVSVAASRFVQYQDAWGTPRPAPRAPAGAENPDRPPAEHTAARYLEKLVSALLADDDGSPEFAVVGERLLLRDDETTHARVRECLDLLVADGGGAAAAVGAENELREKLRKARPPLKIEETPRASILAQMCEVAGVDFAIRHDHVELMEEEHVTLELAADASVANALDEAFPALSGDWCLAHGAVVVGLELFASPGFRVFECGDLLRQLDASYQKQRTQPGKIRGFTGDVRSEGGIDVVVAALVKLLGEDGTWVLVESWGTRVIVRGAVGEIEAAETALKALGWEATKRE